MTTYPLPSATIEFLRGQAAAWGGVGHGFYYRALPKPEGDTGPQVFVPCCIHGLTDTTVTAIGRRAEGNQHEAALKAVGLYPMVADGAFTRGERAQPWFRLPFDEWARRLNVVAA